MDAVEFGTLSAELGWDESTLWSAFSRGLTDRVHDVSGMCLGNLNELIDQAIEIDNYQREPRRERSFHFISSTVPYASSFFSSRCFFVLSVH